MYDNNNYNNNSIVKGVKTKDTKEISITTIITINKGSEEIIRTFLIMYSASKKEY